ncbi:hypothetical protein COL922a_010202 [Colletotrichum nupharicola]|nr:hypothetical protein COL922a_010202 [Colletotrichum nupharicola]
MSSTSFKLNTGATIPAVGLGTWRSEPGEVRKAVAYALKDGYRHIDAALIYGNENETNAKEGLQKTLDALGTDYLDLTWLIHWPVRLVANETSELLPVNPDGTRSVDRSWNQSETWRKMEELYASGKVKAIGVANWSIPYLEDLRKTWTIVPAVNQVELHPYLPQHELRTYCEKLGILLEAYSPLGSIGAPIMSDPEIQQIAAKHNTSAATVLISYHVNQGVVALPKSVSEARITSNRQVVELSKQELGLLNGLAANGKAKRINTPLWGFDLGFADWYGPVESK